MATTTPPSERREAAPPIRFNLPAGKKILLVFYSRSGTTRTIAQQIAVACGADLRAIEDLRSRQGFFGFVRSMIDTIANRTPPIQVAPTNLANYDLVVLGAPVWASHMAAPMRTYLNQNRGQFNRVAIFCTMEKSGAEQAIREMANASGRQPIASLALSRQEIAVNHGEKEIPTFVQTLAGQV